MRYGGESDRYESSTEDSSRQMDSKNLGPEVENFLKYVQSRKKAM